MPEPQQRRIWVASATYTTAHGSAGSLTHWSRPGIEPATSWFLVGFVNHWATMGTPKFCKKCMYIFRLNSKSNMCCSSWWPSGLRTWCCHCCGLGCCYGTGSSPGSGTFCIPWAQPKRKEKKEIPEIFRESIFLAQQFYCEENKPE